jgi:hypothetical protein
MSSCGLAMDTELGCQLIDGQGSLLIGRNQSGDLRRCQPTLVLSRCRVLRLATLTRVERGPLFQVLPDGIKR